MNQLKYFLKSVIKYDQLSEIMMGNPTSKTYTQFLMDFQKFKPKEQEKTYEKIIKQFKKSANPEMRMRILLLLHMLCQQQPHRCYMLTTQIQPICQNEKPCQRERCHLATAYTHFNEFYIKFIEHVSCYRNNNAQNGSKYIKELTHLRRRSCENIRNFLKISFVVQQILMHTGVSQAFRYAITKILVTIHADLISIHQFLQKYAFLILENTSMGVQLNIIYDEVVRIKRETYKLQQLANIVHLRDLQFPKYTVDKKFNYKVEKLCRKPMLTEYVPSQMKQAEEDSEVKWRKKIVEKDQELDEQRVLMGMGGFSVQ